MCAVPCVLATSVMSDAHGVPDTLLVVDALVLFDALLVSDAFDMLGVLPWETRITSESWGLCRPLQCRLDPN